MFLSTLAQKKFPDLALNVVDTMRATAVEVNSIHISAVVGAAARSARWTLALWLLQSPELLADPNVFAWNAGISACEAGKEWERALLLFESMPAAGIEPDKVSRNAAISACKSGSNWQLAVNLLRSFDSADVISFGAAITACEKCGMWEEALSLAESMQARRISLDLVCYNAMMSACQKGQQWQCTLGLLFRMPLARLSPDVVSFNAAITACEQGSQWQLALSILATMPASRISPDLMTFNAMISACASSAQWELALSTLREASIQYMPDTISFSAAITALEKGCQWEMALNILRRMPEASAEPNLVSFNAAISACEKGWQWEHAMQIFGRLPDLNLTPDLITYNATVAACEKGAQWLLAMDLLFKMYLGRQLPDDISFNSATIACEKAGAWQATLDILELMLKVQILPDAVFAGSATSAFRAALGPAKAMILLRSLRPFWQRCNARGPQSKALATSSGVIAISKPAGVTTEDLVEALQEQCQPHGSLRIVSRLDHPTSGVLPLAVGIEGSMEANWLRAQFAGRLVSKEYLCLCEGAPFGARGTINAPLLTKEVDGVSRSEVSESFGREAVTEYAVLKRYNVRAPRNCPEEYEAMLLSVKPLTGRTHQIRVHLASVGRPLAGDLTYGRKHRSILNCPRLFLHCCRIQLMDINDEVFSAEATLPSELMDVLEALQPFRVG
ncbi:unnamed protein product [Durusdinium trenchii]